MHRGVLDGRDENGMIAASMARDDSAFHMSGSAAEQGDTVLAALNLEVVEAVGIRVGEASRRGLLLLGENTDADPFLLHQRRMDRCRVVHAREHEWR